MLIMFRVEYAALAVEHKAVNLGQVSGVRYANHCLELHQLYRDSLTSVLLSS